MRRIIYDVAASLDGYIARPDGSLEGFCMEGAHVDAYLDRLGGYTTVIMGRRTYEAGYGFGLTPGARPYPHMETFVFSRTIDLPADSDVTVVAGEPLAVINRLRRAAGGDIYLSGGSRFAAMLMRHGFVDRLLIKLNPVILGNGLPLAGPGVQSSLKLTAETAYGNGVVLLDYEVAARC